MGAKVAALGTGFYQIHRPGLTCCSVSITYMMGLYAYIHRHVHYMCKCVLRVRILGVRLVICHILMCLCVQKGGEIPKAVRAKLTKVQLSFGDPFEQVCGEGFLA